MKKILMNSNFSKKKMNCGYTRSKRLGTNAPAPSTKTYQHVKLRSAYLGDVMLTCNQLNPDTVLLEGQKGANFFKTVDAFRNGILITQRDYSLSELAKFPSAMLSISQCEANGKIIDTLRAKPSLTTDEQRTLHNALIYNFPVDVHRNTIQFSEFMKQFPEVTLPTLNLSVFDVTRFDNAFFSPNGYMVYGNGNDLFYPLAGLDVGGHEEGHRNNDLVCKMPYQFYAAAQHEGFADCWGCTYEKYNYHKFNEDKNPFNDIKGEFDWDIGEDIGKKLKILRRISDPHFTHQPAYYQEPGYWITPNFQSQDPEDDQGAHTNCSIVSFTFYKVVTKLNAGDLMKTMKEFVQVMIAQMGTRFSFTDFRDGLKKVYGDRIAAILSEMRLTDDMVDDWVTPTLQPKTKKAKK